MLNIDQAMGMFVGLAIGDALGAHLNSSSQGILKITSQILKRVGRTP